MIASNALLAEFLNMKLAPMPIVYKLVSEFAMLTPNTLSEMKNRMSSSAMEARSGDCWTCERSEERMEVSRDDMVVRMLSGAWSEEGRMMA